MDALKSKQGQPPQGQTSQTQSTLQPNVASLPRTLEAFHADKLDTPKLVLAAPLLRPERIALFNDYLQSLPRLESEERDAGLKDLAGKLNLSELDSLNKSASVADAQVPEEEFHAAKVARLGAIPETITTEESHLKFLEGFVALLSDKTLQNGLSRRDRAWLQSALPDLKFALSASAQMLQNFHLATGISPNVDVKQAFKDMSPEQRRAASENLLRVFNGSTYTKGFMEAASRMNAKFDDWLDFSERNQALLSTIAQKLGIKQLDGFGYNAAMPMVQRAPRYELLLKEAARTLPSSYMPLASAAQLRAKSVGVQINQNRGIAEDAAKAKKGFWSRLFGRGSSEIASSAQTHAAAATAEQTSQSLSEPVSKPTAQATRQAVAEREQRGLINRLLSWFGWR